MKIFRWIIGLLILGCLFYLNFFYYEAPFLLKLVNVILFCSLFVLYRVIFGPSPADRIVAVDIFGILIIGLLAILSIIYDEGFLMDIGLIWALLSFVASLAFAKILQGRSLDE
ncbi:MAG: hypothetical protein JXA68_07610 [Ignavibacteriales bacterium]|nr:hypothetical protein [Ignavibacteriales bacterium]